MTAHATAQDMRQRRATPADPMPGAGPDLSFLDNELRQIPPELGHDALAVLDGRSFMYSDPVGDVPEGTIGGLVVADTR
ncbi:MAG: glycogen debranching protein, partial [Dactylosporangium sp.]|nr:glycogen debranching protein [Dactylosporangium sp.]